MKKSHQHSSRHQSSGAQNLLIVDDDQELLGFLAEFFHFHGIDCTTASDGYLALSMLEVKKFSLLVTDVAMPGIDGIELIKKVSQIAPSMPKVVLSGEEKYREIVADQNIPNTWFFSKPISNYDEFISTIQEAMGEFRAEEESAQGTSEYESKGNISEWILADDATDGLFQSLIENSNDGVLLFGESNRLEFVNDVAVRLIGVMRGEIFGQSDFSYLPTVELKLFFHQLIEAGSSALRVEYETELIRPNNTSRIVHVSSIAISIGGKQKRAVYLRDITAYEEKARSLQQKSERLSEQLQETESNDRPNFSGLHNFLNTANAMAMIIDRDFRILEWNATAERISGIAKREAFQKDDLQFLFPNFATGFKNVVEQNVWQGRGIENLILKIACKNDETRTISWNIGPVKSAGEIVGAMMIGIDTSSEIALQEELEKQNSKLEEIVSKRTGDLVRSQNRYKKLFEGVRDAMFSADVDGKLVEVNNAWLNLFGYKSKEDVTGKHFLFDFVTNVEDAQNSIEYLNKNSFFQDKLLSMNRRDGSIVSTLITVNTDRKPFESESAFEGVIRDVTRMRQLEQRIIEHSQDLELTVRSRSAELAESEAKFRRLTENSPDIIYRIDIRKMVFDYLSPAASRITGFSIERLRTMGPDGFASRVHLKDSSKFINMWNNIAGDDSISGDKFEMEYRFVRADSEAVWLSDRGSLVRSASGELIAIEGVMQDITSQKSAATHLAEQAVVLEMEVARRTEALTQSEYRYRTLLGEAGDIIFMCDNDGKVRELNRRGEELLGRGIREINLTGFGALLDEGSRRRFNKALMTCLKAGIKPEPYQIEYVTPGGSKLLLEIQSSPLVIDGQAETVLQVARDLTSRRRAAQAIRTLKEFNEGIIRSMSEGIFIENDEGECEFVNPAMTEMLGFKPGEVEGRRFLDFIPDTDRDFAANQAELRRIRGFVRYEIKLVSANGDEIPVHISSRTRIEGEKVVGGLSVVTDLRQTKEMEGRQRFMERLLADERKLADIGMLAAGIAHNISSPLMVISGYVQLLRSKLPKIKEFDVILGQIDKISEITRNMMVKSRSEQDKAIRPIDLNVLLQTELKFLEANLAFKSKIEKQYSFDSKVPKLQGVYSDFSQAFSNIINNAIDAMYNRNVRRLTVTTKRDGDHICINISDTGGGIDPEYLEKIFDPFFTTKPSVTEQKEGEPTGTGLGLSTSNQLVKNYGGKIEVESVPGVGSTFTIIFPVNFTVAQTSDSNTTRQRNVSEGGTLLAE